MADKFNLEDSKSPIEPRSHIDCAMEILNFMHNNWVVEPLKSVCSRKEGVAMSVQSLNLKVDHDMDAAYADYA